MKKIALLVLFILMLPHVVLTQSCLPDGITFKTQEEIDNFQTNYPACTEIEGNVQIEGDEISSLSGLSILTSIQGRLRFYTCKALENMTGLENLTSVGGDLIVYTWPSSTTVLTSLTGLENVSYVGGDLEITGSDKLLNCNGLDGLYSIGGDLAIGGNESIQNLSGLDMLDSVGGAIWIGENIALNSLAVLGNLTHVEGSIEIYDNDALRSLAGMESLDMTVYEGYWIISYNDNLSDCAVLSLCNYLALPESSVEVFDNAAGCDNLEEVQDACAVSVDTHFMDKQFSIYPVPAKDRVHYRSDIAHELQEVKVYNQLGQIVLKQEYATNPIDISALSRGIYVMEFVAIDLVSRKKLVVE